MNALTHARIATARMWTQRDRLLDEYLDAGEYDREQSDLIDEMAKAAHILDSLAGHIYDLRNKRVDIQIDEEIVYPTPEGAWMTQ